MLIEEFSALTGIYPPASLYSEIEKEYYEFDGNKAAFCAAYKNNVDGIAERVAMRANGALASSDASYERTISDMSDEITRLNEKIVKLEKRIEKEEEWKPWVSEHTLSQERYDSLKNCSSSHEMTDEEAKEWLYDEFGFAMEKVSICRSMNTYEVNRHRYLRKVGEVDRTPYYDATDWYYIFFTVCGCEYEAYAGSVHRI